MTSHLSFTTILIKALIKIQTILISTKFPMTSASATRECWNINNHQILRIRLKSAISEMAFNITRIAMTALTVGETMWKIRILW